MELKVFKKGLASGLGDPLYYTINNELTYEYIEEIYNACSKCLVFDTQCEGYRTDYLFELIKNSGKGLSLQDRLLDDMEKRDGDDLAQLYKLAVYFHNDGNKRAYSFMQNNYRYDDVWNDFIGSEEIIEVANEEGLLYVMESISLYMKENQNYVGDDFLRKQLIDQYGIEYLKVILYDYMLNNDRFYEYIMNTKVYDTSKRFNFNITFEELISDFNNARIQTFMVWGKKTSDKELLKAAFYIVNDKHNIELEKLLWIFRRRTFPLDYRFLFKYLNHEDERVRLSTMEILKNYRDKDIRNYAIAKLNDEDWYEFLDLLVMNWEEKDSAVVREKLKGIDDVYVIHSIAMCFGDIIKHNRILDIELLKLIYFNNRCSLCRKPIVEELLMSIENLEDFKRNIAYDSNSEIREKVI